MSPDRASNLGLMWSIDTSTHKGAMQAHARTQARERHGVTLGPGLRVRILRAIKTGRGISSGLDNIYWVILPANERRPAVHLLIVHSPEHDEIVTVLPSDYGQLRRELHRVQIGEYHAVWS